MSRSTFSALKIRLFTVPKERVAFDEMFSKPKKDLIIKLARKAEYVLAVGTCASFGGIGADSKIEGRGLQFSQ
jgi:Ni,Fe-hydrogenase I small subunit